MTPFGEDGYLMFQSGNVLFSTDGTWSSTAHATVEGLNFGVTNVYSPTADKFTNRSSSHLFAMLNNEARTDEKEQGIGKFLEFIRQNSMEWAKADRLLRVNRLSRVRSTKTTCSRSLLRMRRRLNRSTSTRTSITRM